MQALQQSVSFPVAAGNLVFFFGRSCLSYFFFQVILVEENIRKKRFADEFFSSNFFLISCVHSNVNSKIDYSKWAFYRPSLTGCLQFVRNDAPHKMRLGQSERRHQVVELLLRVPSATGNAHTRPSRGLFRDCVFVGHGSMVWARKTQRNRTSAQR